MKFEVLFDGKPLVGHAVSIFGGKALSADQKPFVEVTTDKEGRFSFKPSGPGVVSGNVASSADACEG